MSRFHRRPGKLPVYVALGLIFGLGAKSATIYTEIGDAGELVGTAQYTNSMPTGTALTDILGFLEPGGADLYYFFLTGGKTFSATTVSNTSNFFDTQLFLFTSPGIGIYANDEDPVSPPQSTLPAGISFTPSASGIYLLGISSPTYLPRSAGGKIFPADTFGFLNAAGGVQNSIGPSGPGGGSPLNGWDSLSTLSGNYDIVLTGALFQNVPEPGSFALAGVWILAALVVWRRSQRVAKS
jgi:hypothetical protein